MAKRPSNMKAINEMLIGEHKSQKKTTIGFSDAISKGQKTKNRENGEIWEELDSTGKHICWWELTADGLKIRYNVHPDVAKANQRMREWLRSFPNCPKDTCTCTIPKPIDKKFRKLTGMCEDCTISYETKLKMSGKFDQYAMEKLRANAEAFLRDADKEIEVMKNALRNMDFVDETGIESWTADNIEFYIDELDKRYEKYKEGILEKVDVPKTP